MSTELWPVQDALSWILIVFALNRKTPSDNMGGCKYLAAGQEGKATTLANKFIVDGYSDMAARSTYVLVQSQVHR